MAKKRFGPEQVAAKLRQIEVLTTSGELLPQACKEAEITDVTCPDPYTNPRTFGKSIPQTQKPLPRWLS